MLAMGSVIGPKRKETNVGRRGGMEQNRESSVECILIDEWVI